MTNPSPENAADAFPIHLRDALVARDAARAGHLAALHAEHEVGVGDERAAHRHEVEALVHGAFHVGERQDAPEEDKRHAHGAPDLARIGQEAEVV